MKPKTYASRLLDRIVAILACFENGESELRLTDLVRKTKLHKSTLYRLLEAMRGHGLLGFDQASGRYYLGLKFLELGTIAMRRLDLDRLGQPVVRRLGEEAQETAHLCVLDGSDIVAITRVESQSALHIRSATGYRTPAYSTAVGKAILANLTCEELDAYIAKTPLVAFTRNTITSSTKLRAELKTIADQGYSVDHEEREEGVQCIAAPVRDHSGRAVAAISVLAPSSRLTSNKRCAELIRMTLEAAAALSSRLGYQESAAAQNSHRAAPAADGTVVTLRVHQRRRGRPGFSDSRVNGETGNP
jgi:IclR family transcriptional regulator, KDG regulon repressor